MALVRCARCGGPALVQALACPHCGQGARVRRSVPRGGTLVERNDPLTRVVRRVLICMLMAIVGGTWLAVATYMHQHREQETADQRAQMCATIEETGEGYWGELANCRNRLAYLRVVERR